MTSQNIATLTAVRMNTKISSITELDPTLSMAVLMNLTWMMGVMLAEGNVPIN